MQLIVEMTDLFAGEANYSWVRRVKMRDIPDCLSTPAIVRRVKKELGLTGRHETDDQGDRVTIRPRNQHVIVFVDFTA
jgi:hypothetical protein